MGTPVKDELREKLRGKVETNLDQFEKVKKMQYFFLGVKYDKFISLQMKPIYLFFDKIRLKVSIKDYKIKG